MLVTVDDILDLRRNVLLCRQFRQEMTTRRDWRSEIFAERQCRSARQRYRAAVRLLRCPH